MVTAAPLVSAVAATVAAVLAGAGLIAAGRRENVKWAREALVETLTTFLDASFACKNIVKPAVRERVSLGAPEIDEAYARAREVEVSMRGMQTRLRLLATPEVVDAAQAVRDACRAYVEVLRLDAEAMGARDKPLREELWMARIAFISASKSALSLPRGWRGVPRSVREATRRRP